MQIKRVKYADMEITRQIFGGVKNLKEDFFGSSPAPFVGRYGYPYVNVGILATFDLHEEVIVILW